MLKKIILLFSSFFLLNGVSANEGGWEYDRIADPVEYQYESHTNHYDICHYTSTVQIRRTGVNGYCAGYITESVFNFDGWILDKKYYYGRTTHSDRTTVKKALPRTYTNKRRWVSSACAGFIRFQSAQSGIPESEIPCPDGEVWHEY